MNCTAKAKLAPMMVAVAAERKKAARIRLVNKLAAHLIPALHVNPSDLSFVFSLSDGSENNNLAAVKFWLECNLSNDNADENIHYWELKLAKKLSATVI